MPLISFLFLSTALFALRSFFSSSESDARSSDSYSWTTRQPSLFLSATLISFWRSLITSSPSATNLRTSDGFSTLPSIWVKMLFKRDFNSNCFLFPLNLVAEASFPILAVSSNCLPFSSYWEVSYRTLKSENTWLTNWEFGVSGYEKDEFRPEKSASAAEDVEPFCGILESERERRQKKHFTIKLIAQTQTKILKMQRCMIP